MRQAVLPENFRCPQQDELFSFLDDLYENGPQIGVITAPPGTGKSHGLRRYRAAVQERYRERRDRRRTIDLQDVKARFRAEGLSSPEDRAWLHQRWQAQGYRQRVSEYELSMMLKSRLHEVGREIEAAKIDPRETMRPCPNVIIVTPSQTTSECEMVKLIAVGVTGAMFNYPGAFEPRQRMLERLDELNGQAVVIIDEAQRLRLGPLNLTREVFDDGGATVVLAGTPDLEANLNRHGVQSLFSRVAIHYRMDGLTPNQVEKLLPGWDPRVVRRIAACTGGIFRRIENLVRLAEQIRQVNEEPRVTIEIVNEAAMHIPDLLPMEVRGHTAGVGTIRAQLARPAPAAAVPEPAAVAARKQAAG